MTSLELLLDDASLSAEDLARELLTSRLLNLQTLQALQERLWPVSGLGVAQVLFGVNPEHPLMQLPQASKLARGWALPWVWRPGEPQDAHADADARQGQLLGHRLGALAQDIKAQLRADAWTLHPHEQIAEFWREYGHALELDPSSGAMALAAALKLAMLGLNTQGHVFATGCWSRGVTPVDDLDAKIDAVRALAGSGQPQALFVPAQVYRDALQLREAKEIPAQELTIHALDAATSELHVALSPLLVALGAPPGLDAPLEQRLGYANLEFLDHRTRAAYHDDYVCDELADALHERVHRPSPQTLIMIVGPNVGLSRFLARLLRPQRLVLIPSGVDPHRLESLRQTLSQRAQVHVYDQPAAPASMSGVSGFLDGLVQRLRAQGLDQGLVADITAGRATHSVMMVELARRLSAQCIYFAQGHRNNRVVYGLDAQLERFDPNLSDAS